MSTQRPCLSLQMSSRGVFLRWCARGPRAYPFPASPDHLSPVGVAMRNFWPGAMRRFRPACALVLFLLAAPAIARAAWQPGGNPIEMGTSFEVTASGPDRVIVAWGHQFSDYSTEIRTQAWTADGDVVA